MDVKMNNETIEVLVNFIKQQEGWSLDELRDDLIGEGKLMNYENNDKNFTVDVDECSVVWGDIDDGDHICNAGDLVNDYGWKLLMGVCNMLESFKDQECFLYKDGE